MWYLFNILSYLSGSSDKMNIRYHSIPDSENVLSNNNDVEVISQHKGSYIYDRLFLKCQIVKIFLITIILFSSAVLLFQYYFSPNPPILKSSLIRTTAFKPVSHAEIPTAYWGSVMKPYPTGAFWTNLAVKSGDSPIAVLPYGIKTLDSGIQISYGPSRRIVSQYAITGKYFVFEFVLFLCLSNPIYSLIMSCRSLRV